MKYLIIIGFPSATFIAGWWLSSLAMRRRLRMLTDQLRAHSEPLKKAVKENQPTRLAGTLAPPKQKISGQ